MTVKAGSLIGHDQNLQVALAEKRAQLAHVPPIAIFEATFQQKGLLVRTHLLIPHSKGYRLVEVKSTTSVKEHHLLDCARWSGPGNAEFREKVATAFSTQQPIKAVIAQTTETDKVEPGADASALKKWFSIKKEWIGRVVSIAGDEYVFEFTRRG